MSNSSENCSKMIEIKEMHHLLNSSLLKNCTILDHKVTRLTAPGENYGSLMLLVNIKYNDSDKQEKNISVVAKKIPESDWLRHMFKVQVTFKKEMEFYNTVVPTLRQFQEENSAKEILDLFPQYYGGRINLSGSNEVDEDGVMLLENLKLGDFITVDRKKGFDKETTELILKSLAVFHGVPLALKFVKPECFEEKILPHTQHLAMFDGVDDENKDALLQEKINIAKENPETASLGERIALSFDRAEKQYTNVESSPREPFATIVHSDFWVNNVMLKYSGLKATRCKIIDFQIIEYGSPCRDLVFFLFSSVQIPVIRENYDHFIKLYYDTLIKTLSDLDCDIKKFTFEEFENEIKLEASGTEFLHAIIMLKPIYAEQEDLKDLKDMTEDDLKSDKFSDEYKEKAWFIMEEFAKRNWI